MHEYYPCKIFIFWGNPILAIPNIYLLREGFKKNTSFYPHLVDKGGGRPMWLSERGGSAHVDNFFLIRFLLNVEMWIREEVGGGGQQMWIRIFACFRPF
jgi:hypothetical protein